MGCYSATKWATEARVVLGPCGGENRFFLLAPAPGLTPATGLVGWLVGRRGGVSGGFVEDTTAVKNRWYPQNEHMAKRRPIHIWDNCLSDWYMDTWTKACFFLGAYPHGYWGPHLEGPVRWRCLPAS